VEGRKVYVAFDADYAINPDVRHAMVRLFFVLSVAGAEVFVLTDWDLGQARGIDDWLVRQSRSNGHHNPADVLKALLAKAKPFIESVNASALDLAFVCSELEKVLIPGILLNSFVNR
jgi:hypothetical protein